MNPERIRAAIRDLVLNGDLTPAGARVYSNGSSTTKKGTKHDPFPAPVDPL
jgi:hypothetical protein